MFLISLFNASITSFSDIYKGVRLLVLLFAPGCYLALMLGKTMELKLDEILAIDFMISIALSTLVSIYLSFPLTQITDSAVSIGLLIPTLLSGLFCLPRLLKDDELRENVNYLNISKAVISLLVSFFIGFLLVFRVIPTSYWRGWDPWLNVPVIRIILEKGLNPSELVETGLGNLSVSGFFYFIALVRAFTGIDGYTMTRFGGPVLTGIVSVMTYLIVRKLEGLGASFLASFFLCINPFFITRFSMTIRENFSYLFLLEIVFFLITSKMKQKNGGLFDVYHMFSISLFLSVVLISHSLTSLIIYGIMFLELIYSLFKDNKKYVLELLLALFLSFLMVTPYINVIYTTFNWIIINQIPINITISLFFILIASLMVFLFYYKWLIKLDFIKKYEQIFYLIITMILLIGAFNSILFPKTFSVLGLYNPPITIDNFATSIFFLAILGFISTLWAPISITVMSNFFIILLLINLSNFNIAFPLFRIVIYLTWILSYYAVKGIKLLSDLINKLKFILMSNIYNRKSEKSSFFIFIIIVIIISPFLIENICSMNNFFSYYNDDDIYSTEVFLNKIKENDIVLPQGWAHNILLYCDINPQNIILDTKICENLYTANSIEEFSQIIMSHYPNVSKIYVFIIERRINNNNYPITQLDLLNLVGNKNQIGTIIYYEITFS